MTDEEMAKALEAKGYKIKAPVDQATCRHVNTRGIGSAGSDGSSSFTGYCVDCGKDLSYKREGAPSKPFNYLTDIFQN